MSAISKDADCREPGEPSAVEHAFVLSERVILGEVEVSGFVYRIHQLGLSEHEVVRCIDGQRVGRLRGSPSLMWLLEAEGVGEELLHEIVQSAIEEGFFADLPTD